MNAMSLERLFLQKVASYYQIINQSDLQGRLAVPVFRVSRSLTQWGSWNASVREMSFSFPLMMNGSEHSWLWIIRHEMAHQVVSDLLGAPAETAHGPHFRQACQMLGISHSAHFKSQDEPTPLGQKIQKLLALAESDNVHEAELALQKAKALALEHFAFDPAQESPFVTFHLAEVAKRSAVHQFLAGLLQNHFGTVGVWVQTETVFERKSAWVLEISGQPADVEIAQFVWFFLLAELKRLWSRHKRKNPGAHKRSFETGVLAGVGDQLNKAKANPLAEAGKQLVLVRDHALHSFVRHQHERLSRGRSLNLSQNADWQSGRLDGQKIELNKPVRSGTAPRMIGSTEG